jgi:uncharacterized membrane protein YccC
MDENQRAPKSHDEWVADNVLAASAAVRYLLRREMRSAEQAMAASDTRLAGERESMAEDLHRLRALLEQLETAHSRARRPGPHIMDSGWLR